MDYKNNSNGFVLRRGFAYIIDILLITIISALVTQITIINPQKEQYQEEYTKYEELIRDTTNIKDLMANEDYENISYNLSKYGVVYTFSESVLLFGYFVLFQYFNKGQTIGKKFMKIKVTSNDGEKAKFWQLALRSIVVYEIVFNILLGIFVIACSKELYININSAINIVYQLLFYITIIMLVFRKDGRGLHDLIAKTKVEDLKNAQTRLSKN